jgi:hypothetical protein
MLVLEQYGIKLKRLTIDDIELVRMMRNLPKIRKQMAFKKYITQKMQLSWFDSIDNSLNYYFLIEVNNEKIGVINCKNVCERKGYGEGGIFIWSDNLENEYIPVLASLCLLNAVFLKLNLFNKSFIQILRSNSRAQFFNQKLGYVLIPGQESKRNPYYLLTKEDYLNKTHFLRSVANKLSAQHDTLRITGTPSEKNLPAINAYLERQNSLG